jgi:hypothetical protein
MSPKGCLSTSFVLLLAAWSLLVGGLVVAGWLGAEILDFALRVLLGGDGHAARIARDLLEALRTIGFGMMAGIWAIGAAVLGALWVAFRRGAAQQRMMTDSPLRRGRVIDIEVVEIDDRVARPGTAPPGMKDVTPRRPDELPPPGKG